jgi:two-component system, cell cycle response regulator CpdR
MQSESVTKGRILVIDDDIDILSLLDDVFSYNGFEVDAQLDPVLALKHFHDNPKSYDLTLLDLWLGSSVDGLSLYNKLKEANIEAKIFVFTAPELDLAQFTMKCPSFNESYLIRKPIQMNVLVDRINSVLN